MPYAIPRRERLSLLERLYVPALLRGLWVTARHFLKNLFHLDDRITIEYPEVTRALAPGYRAEHRLLTRADGSIRCTACMLCATVCPAQCIAITAEEVDDPAIEKRAQSFSIDMLRCVFCGLCVEACPCDAIRMDSGRYQNAAQTRSALLYGMQKLQANEACGATKLSRALLR